MNAPVDADISMQTLISPEVALIATVATKRVAHEVEHSPLRKSLFRIVGLDPQITSAIGHSINSHVTGADVFIHNDLNDGTLPSSVVTSYTATHFRNMERPAGGGVIVFAVPTSHLDVVGATVGEIKQLSELSLAQMPQLWISCCSELQSGLDDRQQAIVANAITGFIEAGLLTGGLRMLARFTLRLDGNFHSMPIERALDEALPEIRIPRGMRRFKDFASRGRTRTKERWAEDFSELHAKAEDALYLRTDRGTPLDRNILRDQLRTLSAEARVSDDEYNVLTALIDDDRIQAGKWRRSQEDAVQLHWELFERLLKKKRREKKEPLGLATLHFFEDNLPSVLESAEKKLLEAVVGETDDADDDEREFFFRHREHFREDKKLLKRWETYVFRRTEQHSDLLAGILLVVADLVDSVDTMPSEPRVVIKLEGADKKSFWKAKNAEICRYLRDRYRGLPELLLPSVICDFGMCWTHNWDDSPNGTEKSSLPARQFKFDIFLISGDDVEDGKSVNPAILRAATHKSQLVWVMPPNSVANSYSSNMREIANGQAEHAYLAKGRFSRAQRTDRVADGIIDLEDRGTIQDVYGGPDGLLIDVNDVNLDVGRTITDELELLGADLLPATDVSSINRDLERFRSAYTVAVRAFTSEGGRGLLEDAVFEQSRLYGEFLINLRLRARKDECRGRLWIPALSIGVAISLDRPVVAISCPWHPFRLAEAATKAARAASALREMIEAAPNGTDLRTYARSVTASLSVGWHPTVSLVPNSPRPRLLVETEHYAEFALMEPPTADEGAEDAFDGYSKEAASEFLAVAQEYLDLNPHERANFSLVLYNADNRDLPSRLADQLARKIENERDLRCELILTHTDQHRLRSIYAEQNVAISQELDGALASEAAQTFLSRLRVGFLDVDAVGRGAIGGQISDMVFLHDVIARSAHTSWRKCDPPAHGWPTFRNHCPTIETRRCSFERGARKTEVLLVPAERPKEVQDYIDLVHDLHRDYRDRDPEHFVPIREISFDDGVVGKAIDQAHKVARWVVTFDAIADLQLLRSNDISVIRFITKPGSAHNLIVSTKQNSQTLRSRIVEQIGPILQRSGSEMDRLADKCINEAAHISGRVVLRAARLEQNALELLGLVLSRRLIMDSVGQGVAPIAWLLLDDFAEWLGHKGKKADILVLCLGQEGGQPFLEIVVVESKFVCSATEAQEAAYSLSQTKATTNDLRDRIVLDGDRLNRLTWRARLADLLLEHGAFPLEISGKGPQRWAGMLRSDEANIRIRGLSLVFVHDCTDRKPEAVPSESMEQRQFVFDRDEIARLLRRIESPTAEPALTVDLPKPVSSGSHPSVPGTHLDDASEELGISSQEPGTEKDKVVHETDVAWPEKVDAGVIVPGYPPNVSQLFQAQPSQLDDRVTIEWLDTIKTKLRVALRTYGLDAEIAGERLTPNAALVRFRGTDRMTVAEVERRREILLTSHGLDVIGVRPERGEVVIMVAREQRARLNLFELWRRRSLPQTAPFSNGALLIGEKEHDGELLYLNLAEAFGGQPQHGPHTLIAGETGGGKGVLTRNLVLELCATNSPASARIRFVDPKMGGDYPWITQLPHLDGGLVTSQDAAMESLRELVETMESRYAQITRIAPNVDRYNSRVEPEHRLPRIYFFHDELGDWMADRENADYRDAIGNYVVRLASKARAAGIHLFLITQRPDKDALPSLVKANMNNKICLRVSSQVNSRIVLDEGGAENLLGHGHFAARLANERPSNQTSLIFGQAPFLDDDAAWELAEATAQFWNSRDNHSPTT